MLSLACLPRWPTFPYADTALGRSVRVATSLALTGRHWQTVGSSREPGKAQVHIWKKPHRPHGSAAAL
jgi:hypothetical protein